MKKSRRNHSEIDFWQSNTDLMTGIVLVLLLIIMLLILYMMQAPDEEGVKTGNGGNYNIDNELGDTIGEAYHYPEQDQNRQETDENRDSDGGDGGGKEEEEKEEKEYEFPFPSSGGEEWGKSAVYTTVVDEETGRAIREQGITFELYEEQLKEDGGALRFLNTYYPVKTEYRNFETTEEGVFYLPEKVEKGNYYFKQITEMEGYDPAEMTKFVVDDIYDWPDPFVVSVKVSPSRNIIPVSLEDRETHAPIEDGTFKVTAAEDIITADGTLRYEKNELADTVTLDEEGYGESKEVYLGKYIVSQGEIPRYYAGIMESAETDVKKKGAAAPETLKFSCEKTKISLKLTDELYTNLKLEGAEFALNCEGHPEFNQSAVTDKNGEIVFTDLEKNVTYHLKQISAPEKYRFTSDAAEIYVTENGYIEDDVNVSLKLTNYIARVNIEIRDRLFRKPVSDVGMALYNSSGEKLRTWTSSGEAKTFENLPGGNYYILTENNKKYEFVVDGDKTLQEVSMTVLTIENMIVIVVGCGVGVFAIFAAASFLKKKKSSNRAETGKEDEL